MSMIGASAAETKWASIRRTPMRGLDRYVVTYVHPGHGGFYDHPCITLRGARRFAARVDRAHQRAGERS